MQLTYRGVAYQLPEASVELPKSSQTGKYRGKVIEIPSTVKIWRQSLSAFKYRGVDYSKLADLHLQPIISAVESKSTQI